MNDQTVRNATVERLLYITLAMIFVGLSIAVTVLIGMLRAQQNTTNQVKNAVVELESHTNCIALLLQQSNRGAVRIGDLENCKIVPN